MKPLLILCLLSVSTSAMAAGPCFLRNGPNDLVVFDSDNAVHLTQNGQTSQCTWMVTPDREYLQDIVCDNGVSSEFFFAGATPDSGKQDLLFFDHDIWYRTDCPA